MLEKHMWLYHRLSIERGGRVVDRNEGNALHMVPQAHQ